MNLCSTAVTFCAYTAFSAYKANQARLLALPTQSKSRAISDEVLSRNMTLHELSSLLGTSLRLNHAYYQFSDIYHREVSLKDNNDITHHFTIVHVMLDDGSKYQVVFEVSGEFQQLTLVDAATADAVLKKAQVFLSDDYLGRAGLALYTDKLFFYINQYLRSNTIITKVDDLQRFQKGFLLQKQQHDDAVVAEISHPHRIEYMEKINEAYTQYHFDLETNQPDDKVQASGRLYLSLISGYMNTSFMTNNHTKFTAVYRGISIQGLTALFPENEQDVNNIPILKVGDISSSDPAFMSTSVSIKNAQDFATVDPETGHMRPQMGVVLKILNNASTPSQALSLEKYSVYKGEEEILLPPGRCFKVLAINDMVRPARIKCELV